MLCGAAEKVIEIVARLSQPSRCTYEDDNGRCRNSCTAGSPYCTWHDELIALRMKMEQDAPSQGGV